MSTLIAIGRRQVETFGYEFDPRWRRGLAVAALALAAASIPGGWSVALPALADAYLAVAVFVAATLAMVHGVERLFGTDLGDWLQRYRRWQVPVAALLGAFPGCGGAIVAVTQFTRGYMSFGGVVAALTATMGDAMFLLLAREPTTALGVAVLGILVGTVTGWAIDAWRGQDYQRVRAPAPIVSRGAATAGQGLGRIDRVWLALAVPGLGLGVAAAIQIEVDEVLGLPVADLLGIAGAVLALGLWVMRGESDQACAATGTGGACTRESNGMLRRVVDDTNFVTAWVVFAFVAYELAMIGLGLDLGAAFAAWGPWLPAIAVLVGLVPGCGPQIVLTSAYLSGAAPLSAQLGNAISNDGDALFPALAVAPKAAFLATLYSLPAALLVGYGWYLAFEIG
jgi:hypothetical protein